MEYVDFKGDKLSRLGFGMMRLPIIDGDLGKIDIEATRALINRALEGGINYFDTAYAYHLQKSELVVGPLLKEHPRDSYFLADKFPGHEIRKSWDPEAIFEEQLAKTGHDYFDYYLIHNVYENSVNVYLDPQWGIVDYIIAQKEAGRIRHVGFSTHGHLDVVSRFLDAYGAHMEFCQMELNYLDWTLQNAASLYAMLRGRDIPIWVMEPVRGGALAQVAPEFEAEMQRLRPGKSPAEWAFRWVQGKPGVEVILSGMSTKEQLEENLATFATEEPLGEAERALTARIAETMADKIPCTACRYCVPHCPVGLNIPKLLAFASDMKFNATVTVGMQIDGLPEGKRPQDCEACGACTRMCPQGIDIPGELAALDDAFQKLPHWADVRKYD